MELLCRFYIRTISMILLSSRVFKIQFSLRKTVGTVSLILVTLRRHTVILISNDRTSASKKINRMVLIQTLTVSTIAFERKKEELYGFRQTELARVSVLLSSLMLYQRIFSLVFNPKKTILC